MQSSEHSLTLADRIEETGHALTARELSQYLSVSTVTIFKLAAARRISSFRVGLFDPRRIATWLRRRECGGELSRRVV